LITPPPTPAQPLAGLLFPQSGNPATGSPPRHSSRRRDTRLRPLGHDGQAAPCLRLRQNGGQPSWLFRSPGFQPNACKDSSAALLSPQPCEVRVPGSAEPQLGARMACAWHAHKPPVGLSKAGLAITGRTSRAGARRSGAPTCCRLSGRRHPVARINTAPLRLPPTADRMSAHRQRAECTRSGAFRHLSLDTRPSVGGAQGDTRHKIEADTAGGGRNILPWIRCSAPCHAGIDVYHGTMTLKAIIHDAEEGGFWAEVPALPG